MRLGVLGGTFDPVHFGHLILAEHAREQLTLQRVLFVPAGQPWRKVGREITSAEQRVAMLSLALQCNRAFTVSEAEIERSGPSFTVDTLRGLRREQRQAEMFFIMGEDALADLPNWKEPQRILQLASLAVAPRGGGTSIDGVQRKVLGLTERVIWLNSPTIGISASEIRERVRLGRSIRYLVPTDVERYIVEQGLYLA